MRKEQADAFTFSPIAAHGRAFVVHARSDQNNLRCQPGDLAVLGVPFEDTSAPYAGQSLAPRALRETSVYFGWHANPQFSHPVDIDARQDIQTDGLHERLCDLGDISLGPDEAIQATLKAAISQISRNGACAIILGGSDSLSETVQSAMPKCQTVQLGGIAT